MSELEKVILRVYNVGPPGAVNILSTLLNHKIEGIWHTSIEVYGIEYYYQGGMARAAPNTTLFGYPVKTHYMGETAATKKAFESYLDHISDDFSPMKYHMIKNNCNNFTDIALRFLVDQKMPEYIMEVQEKAEKSEVVMNFVEKLFGIQNNLEMGK